MSKPSSKQRRKLKTKMAINKSEVQQPANVMACDKKTEELYVFFCAYGEYAKFNFQFLEFCSISQWKTYTENPFWITCRKGSKSSGEEKNMLNLQEEEHNKIELDAETEEERDDKISQTFIRFLKV